MLVVMAIIATLAGLLVTGIVAAQNSARKNRTKVAIKQLAFAIGRYQNDWGDFPGGSGGPDGAADLWAALSSRQNPGGPYVQPADPPSLDLQNDGHRVFVDSWRRAIHYTHHRHYSGDPMADEYRLQSAGPDGQYDTEDDITNWK